MKKSHPPASLNILEASVLIGLERGFSVSKIARELDVGVRSVDYTIKKLLLRYSCQDIGSLVNLLQQTQKFPAND